MILIKMNLHFNETLEIMTLGRFIGQETQIKNFTKKDYSTTGSQVVSNLSTDVARRCLTSQIGRDEVHSS